MSYRPLALLSTRLVFIPSHAPPDYSHVARRSTVALVVMVNYKYESALHNAAAICLTPEALAACPINTRDRDDHTALHALCRYEGPRRDDDLYDLRRVDDRNAEDVEVCVQLLVDAGADLEAHEENGWSPLHAVAWSSGDLGTEATSRLSLTDVAVIAPRRQSGQS